MDQDRTKLIADLEQVAAQGHPTRQAARLAVDMLRRDDAYQKELRIRGLELRASDEKKAERIEKLVKVRWKREDELALKIRGCLLAGPGRGDCKNYVDLPEEENRETTDEYGRPHGWCQVCWLAEREMRMCRKVRELSEAALTVIRLENQYNPAVDGNVLSNARGKLSALAGDDNYDQAR